MKLKMMNIKDYKPSDRSDPIVFYNYPVIGNMFRRRLSMCLDECKPGKRVLEVGFGSGVSFMNLADIYEEIHGIELNGEVAHTEKIFKDKGINVSLKKGSILNMPYPDKYFDTVLLVSILEHLKPEELEFAVNEIYRVLIPNGQVIYGVPIEKPAMVFMYRLLSFNIREHHFSTEKDVRFEVSKRFQLNKMISMNSPLGIIGDVYEVGSFIKS